MSEVANSILRLLEEQTRLRARIAELEKELDEALAALRVAELGGTPPK